MWKDLGRKRNIIYIYDISYDPTYVDFNQNNSTIINQSILPPLRPELFDDNNFGIIRHSGRWSIPSMTVPRTAPADWGRSLNKGRSSLAFRPSPAPLWILLRSEPADLGRCRRRNESLWPTSARRSRTRPAETGRWVRLRAFN